MTMVGLFFTQECGDHFHTGEIIRQAHADAYFAKIDRVLAGAPVDPLVMFSINDFSAVDDDGHAMFRFFETRADLLSWIEWLETPSEKPLSVVTLVKPEKRH